MLLGLASLCGTTEKRALRSLRGTSYEFVESQDFSTSLQKAGLSAVGDMESTNAELGNLRYSQIICTVISGIGTRSNGGQHSSAKTNVIIQQLPIHIANLTHDQNNEINGAIWLKRKKNQ